MTIPRACLVAIALFVAACESGPPPTSTSGGAPTTGGAPPSVGGVKTGGTATTGGMITTGGSPQSGGKLTTGGSAATGGVAATGAARADAGLDSPSDTGRDLGTPPDTTPTGDAAGSPAPFKGVANSTCIEMGLLKNAWFYNWMTTPETDQKDCPQAGEFVPMIWGHTGNERNPTWITNTLDGFVSAGRKYVLGFNEPDKSDQANLTVAEAIALWPSLTGNPAIKVGSPAVQGNATGLTWIKEFMTAVNADTTGKLRVDFIAFHWYGWNAGSCEAKASTLESHLKQLEAIPGNRPLWITEWGCMNASNPDIATVQAFYKGALAMFEKHPRLVRYAWYPWNTNNQLFTTRPPGTPVMSVIGTDFMNAPLYK